MKTPVKPPHIVDIAPTVCAVLGVDPEGLNGQPLLEGNQHRHDDDGLIGESRRHG
jgi:arylsulfatase A-like enzyme